MPQVIVETLAVGSVQTNCYLVENPDSGETLVIDPGAEGERIIAAMGKRKPVAVLLTHGHFDHIGAVDALCSHYHIPVYIHEADADKLTDPAGNESLTFNEHVTVEAVPLALHDGQRLTLGGMSVEALHTPGHSRGSCCYLLENHQCIFCGDTLFDGGYGRYDFADGDFGKLKDSLRKLLYLTPKRLAYPGHGGTTFAGRDREAEQ